MKNSTDFRARRGAFTLIEMMVALAILALMLTIIMVPLKAGFDSFHLGQSKSNNQSAAQTTLDEMERDLRHAIFVYPNTPIQGITTVAPYTNNPISAGVGAPYYKSIDISSAATVMTPTGACDLYGTPKAEAWTNPARLDMLLARTDTNGNLILPLAPSDTIVSYYPRRLNPNKDYDPVDNPVVLYRAEFPFRSWPSTGGNPLLVDDSRKPVNAAYAPAQIYNAINTAARYPVSTDCSSAAINTARNRSSLWLEHNVYGEANLEPLCHDVDEDLTNGDDAKKTNLVASSHTLAMPLGVSLVASQAYRTNPLTRDATDDPTKPGFDAANCNFLVPDSSFDLSDTNGDGKIDRVGISLEISNFDATNSNTLRHNQVTGQSLRATRIVDLPNVR